jgi:hypothetical protein
MFSIDIFAFILSKIILTINDIVNMTLGKKVRKKELKKSQTVDKK